MEMASLKILKDILKGSSWTEARVQAGIASSRKADSFLKASQVTRTRRAHQITASSLYLLQQSACKNYIQTLETDREVMSFKHWCDARSDSSPRFQFWPLILQLELVVMVYLRAIREANFLLYIEALSRSSLGSSYTIHTIGDGCRLICET